MLEQILEKLSNFNIVDLLNSITAEQIIYYSVGVSLVILPILFRKLIGCFLNGRFKYILRKSKLDELSIEKTSKKFAKPFNLVGYLIAITALIKYFDLDLNSSSTIMTNIQHSLGVGIVFWLLHTCINLLQNKFNKLKRVLSKEMVAWFVRILKVLIIFLGIASILEIWGIKVAPLLAGLGLFGVAVALGAQDLFKNIISGISVIAEKRFESGEWIKIDGIVEGTVENIGFRSTKIVRFDKSPVYVPNTKLSDNAVINFSRMSHRQLQFKIGVLYSTTTQQIKQICDEINEYIKNNDDFAKENVTTFVKMVEFNASSIDIQIYAFTKTKVWTEWLQIRQDLQCKIKEIVENAGTEFAFPSTSLYLGNEEKDIFSSNEHAIKTEAKAKSHQTEK